MAINIDFNINVGFNIFSLRSFINPNIEIKRKSIDVYKPGEIFKSNMLNTI